MPSPDNLPTFMQKVKNLSGTVKDCVILALQTGQVVASSETVQTRIKHCTECPHLTTNLVCEKCGCKMKIKWSAQGAACPIGKW